MSKLKRNDKCAFVRFSAFPEFLHRRIQIEERFAVNFSWVDVANVNTRCESDIVAVNIVGPAENVEAACNYLDLMSSDKFVKTVHYSDEVISFWIQNNLLFELLERTHRVIVHCVNQSEIRIVGRSIADVNDASSALDEFIRKSMEWNLEQLSDMNEASLTDLTCSNIPQSVKDSLRNCKWLTAPAMQILISWIRRAYNVVIDIENAECDESIVILDEQTAPKEEEDMEHVAVASTSGLSANRNNDESAEDSVLIINAPSDSEAEVITISDDEIEQQVAVDTVASEGSIESDTQIPAGQRKRKRNRKKVENVSANLPLSEPALTSMPIVNRKRKRCDEVPVVPVQDMARTFAVAPPVVQIRRLRPIVIDGSNVAREHGKPQKMFSCKGILLAVEYFLKRGHTEITTFVPQFRRKTSRRDTIDHHILEQLADKQMVVFTPSKVIQGKCVSSYDDRFIVKLAHEKGGVILSNDQFKDLVKENPSWKDTVEFRSLMFCFVGDIIMIPDDPLGRNGPSITEFLSFPPIET